MNIYVFLADGFEEIEAIAPIDIFRRAGLNVTTVSVNGKQVVAGAHGIPVLSDAVFEDIRFANDSLLFLPGGLPGTYNLDAHRGLKDLLATQAEQGKEIAAICAAPSILGKMGVLENKEAICYPGFEAELLKAKLSVNKIVKSDNIFTAKAAGVAIPFALKIVEEIKGKEIAEKISKGIFFE